MLLRLVLAGALIGCGRFGFDPRASDAGDAPDAELDAPADAPADATSPIAPIMISPARFSTTSATFVDVPGGALTIPASPGQTWVLLVSATLQSTSLAEVAAEARYLVDGVEQGMGGTQNGALDRPGPWQHFYKLVGKATPTEIVFQLRDATAQTGTIEQLRAVAMPVPASADPLYASDDPIHLLTVPAFQTFAPAATLALTPASPGDYVVLLLVTASEAPGASDIETRWLDPAGQPWQTELQVPRQPWQSNLLVRRTTLTGATTLVLEAATRAQAQVRTVRALALRTSGLASFDFTESSTPLMYSMTSPTSVATLTPAVSSARSYIALGSMRLDDECDNGVFAQRRVHYTYGAITDVANHLGDNCAYETTYGTVRLLPTRPATLRAEISSANSEVIVHRETSLLLIGVD